MKAPLHAQRVVFLIDDLAEFMRTRSEQIPQVGELRLVRMLDANHVAFDFVGDELQIAANGSAPPSMIYEPEE